MRIARHRMVVRSAALIAAFVAGSGTAHATPIPFELIGVTTSAGSLSGTVSIDSVTGKVTAADITFNDAAVGTPVFTNIGSPNAYNGLGQDYISGPSDSPLNYGGQIALYYDTASLLSSAGVGDLSVCLSSGACGTESNQGSYVQAYVSNGDGGPFAITGGSLDPSSATGATGAVSANTPEPIPLLLLGTGILAVAGIAQLRARKI